MNKIYKIKVGKQIKNDSFHGKICYRWIIQLNKRTIWRHIKVQPFVAPLCAYNYLYFSHPLQQY